MKKLLLLLLLVGSCINLALSACDSTTDAATYTSERASNGVEMKFYRVQTGEWSDDGLTSKVTAVVINHANTYCANNPYACGLTSCCDNNNFKETMVIVSSGYPQNKLKDLLFKISLDFPADLNSTGSPSCVMGQSVLQEIIDDAREDIHDETGLWITYIAGEFFGIPPPTELNKIIIPIAVAVVLGLVILTIILNLWNKKREESLRRKKIIEQRKKSKKEKDAPVYNVDSSKPVPPAAVTGKLGEKQKPKRELSKEDKSKDQLYKDNLKQSTLSSKKTGSIASEDSAIKLDTTDTRHRQAFRHEKELDGARGYGGGFSGPEVPPASHLKPIDSGADDEARSPEKKKKKKKKRSKSKEVMEGVTNDGYSNAGRHTSGTNVWSYTLN